MLSFFEREFTFNRVCRIFFSSLLVVGIGLLAWRIQDALIPFLIGWIIASILIPLVRFFQYKVKLKYRLLSILVTLIAIFGFLSILFLLIVPPTISEFRKTGDLLLKYESTYRDDPYIPTQIRTYINKFIDLNELKERFDSKELMEYIKEYIPKVIDIFTKTVKQIFSLISIIFSILYSFFILLYYEEISEGFFNLIPERWRKQVKQVFRELSENTNRYFRGQTLVASIVGVLFCIGFLIIGIPLAIPLGLFIGLLNMIPYAQFIGLFPTAFLCLLHSADTGIPFWRIILFVLMVFAVVQIIQDTVLTPKIMGKVTGLNPAIILLCLSIGGVLFGVIGIIIALPLAPMILNYYHIYILKDIPPTKLSESKTDAEDNLNQE